MEEIVLKLTARQAFVLRLVLDRVGGHPKETDRQYTQEVCSMLVDQGVDYDDDYRNVRGAIEFLDNDGNSTSSVDFF